MKKLLCLVLAMMLLGSVAMAEGLNPAANTFPIADEVVPLECTVFGARTEIIDWKTNAVTQYWENKLGIDITWNIIPSATAAEMITVAFASNDLPDVMFNGISKDMAVSYGSQGYLMPLNDLIDEWGTNIQIITEEHPEYMPSITSPDGNIYFIAEIRELDSNHTAAPGKMLINTRWLENVGMEAPNTTDELYEVLKAFKEQDANGNGDPNDEVPLFAAGDARVGSYIMQAFTYLGFKDVSPNYYYIDGDSIKATYATDGWKEGLAYMARLYAEGLMDPECFLANAASAKMLTGAEGGTRIGAAESYSYSGLMDLTRLDLTEQYAFIEPLKNSDGVRVTAANSITMTPMFYISADTDKAEAAIRLCDAMMVDPFANNMEGLNGIYGPEGEGWRRAEEGEMAPDGKTPAQYVWLFTWGQPNNINLHEDLNQYYVNELKGALASIPNPDSFNQEAALLNATTDLYLPYAEMKSVSPMLMFAEDEVTEVVQTQEAIHTYMSEAKANFITGKLDIESDWDAYLAELENLQLNWLLEMYETAYARQFVAN